ncbi:MAG: hypothetical protein JNM70_13490 [Anaerolineae bacterium]|nr:hypothetical protein [Anaerolineae bacterium]
MRNLRLFLFIVVALLGLPIAPRGTDAQESALRPGEVVSGRIRATDAASAVVIYDIEGVRSDDIVTFTLTSPQGSAVYFDLYDSTDMDIPFVDAWGSDDGNQRFLYVLTGSAPFQIEVVSDATVDADYTLALEPGDLTEPRVVLAVGQPITDTTSSDEPAVYLLEIASPGVITIRLTSPDRPLVYSVRDAATLTEQFPLASTRNHEVQVFNLTEPGRYQIRIPATDPQPYTLEITPGNGLWAGSGDVPSIMGLDASAVIQSPDPLGGYAEFALIGLPTDTAFTMQIDGPAAREVQSLIIQGIRPNNGPNLWPTVSIIGGKVYHTYRLQPDSDHTLRLDVPDGAAYTLYLSPGDIRDTLNNGTLTADTAVTGTLDDQNTVAVYTSDAAFQADVISLALTRTGESDITLSLESPAGAIQPYKTQADGSLTTLVFTVGQAVSYRVILTGAGSYAVSLSTGDVLAEGSADPAATPAPPVFTTCRVTAIGDVRQRSGPGTMFDQVGSLAADQTAAADGQAVDAAGQTWFRLLNGSWVRADVVVESGDCAELPRVN